MDDWTRKCFGVEESQVYIIMTRILVVEFGDLQWCHFTGDDMPPFFYFTE